MGSQGPEPPNRNSLFSKGWRQGAIFSVPDKQISCVVNTRDSNGIGQKEKRLSSHEKLLLISHDCDIANSAYPYVEALVCKSYDISTEKGLRQVRRTGPSDPRSFVVSAEMGLVAETKYRVLLQKELLHDLPSPDFVITGETELPRFRSWLAMRYARVAIQDRTHELVLSPLIQVYKDYQETEPQSFELFNATVHGIRLRIANEEAADIEVGLLLVLKDLGDDFSDAHLDAVQSLTSRLVEVLESQKGVQFSGTEQFLYEEIRHIHIQRTMELPTTDDASYDQNIQIAGAAPVQTLDQHNTQ